ncbi:hypothetical protein [Beijerinckia mobilis]|uniref:hypothetical protein n=1 Tax=Beijerinckia mobilis TaxID=231434 RepID=UPI00055806F2|nr:hypothetical protein [Beijerinckia mobilis]
MRVVHPISLSLAAPGSGGAISIEGESVDQFRHEKSGYGDSTGARKNKSITSNSCETSSRVLCNGPLEALAGGALSSRFHGWNGISGRRYVCSVFPVVPDALFGGLPDFATGIALAARSEGRGHYRLIRIFEFGWEGDRFLGHPGEIEAALMQGTQEWHIHLLAEEKRDRRAVIADLGGLIRIL